MNIGHYLLSILFFLGIVTYSFASFGNGSNPEDPYAPEYILAQDTFPLQDRYGDFLNNQNTNPFDLKDPGIIEQNVEYDPVTGNYIITETIGDDYYRNPTYMTFEEYVQWNAEQQEQAYFEQLGGFSDGDSGGSGKRDPIEKFDISKSLIDRLFGGSTVDIRPQGEIGLTFGVDFQKRENPSLTLRQQRQGGFDFDMDIRMNVTGKIGEKLNLSTNYNTQATFDFDNQMKLSYDSEAFSDDDIIKKIEAGNVSMPLKGSLIQGSNSLFGLKTELQFGRLNLTLLASQQKSKRQEIQVQGGAQFQEFEVRADEYDENRHFFLTHYNRLNFEDALKNLPQINNLFTVTRLEIWVTNERNDPNNVRDIVALADLGESVRITNENPQFQLPPSPRYPDIYGQTGLPGFPTGTGVDALNVSDANPLYRAILNNSRARNLDDAVAILQNVFGLKQSRDFEKVSARQLNPSEYTFHPQLGFISLNVNLQPDQVLGVSFEYDYNGKTYKVGEFSNDTYTSDSLGVLFVKMLKSTTQRVDLPTWDLMMKNVYSVGAFQVNQEDFKLDIFYEDPGKGEKRFLPDSELKGVPLLQVFNLDNLNVQGDPCPDGIFDFVPGVTINPRNGRIMFPVLEPFSTAIADKIASPALKEKYDYYVLYDSTIVRAREYQELNRFTIRGNYKSSVSSEISLGSFNLPRGSVVVRAGGQILTEERGDIEVDYNIGRVKILRDDILNSGVPITVSFEDNTLFGFQTKTLLGVRADYEVNKNFNVGATYMHLFERPFTQKVNVGDDPINNRIYGLDFNYTTEAPWLTKAVDALPFIQTKAESSISMSAEAAYLQPGHAKAINQGRNEDGNIDRSGVVYVDDFEGSTSGFDLRTPANNWVMASVPQNDDQNNNPFFPESAFIDTTLSGVNRAKLNWYRIEQTVQGGGSNDDPYTMAIPQTEVFPEVNITPGLSNIIQSFDMTYYPDQRGPYNFDYPEGTAFSAGLRENGGLKDPSSRWGGIMRALNTNDFQAANIEYLEFWVLDPFLTNSDNPGDLYVNLGNISEDILRDSRKFFENGLPTDVDSTRNRTDRTRWGVIPRVPAITNAFVNDAEKKKKQDVGLDGLNDADERVHFSPYINRIMASNLQPQAIDAILADPSNDNYRFFRDEAWPSTATVLERYSLFNNQEGNSSGAPSQGRSTAANQLPDTEDLNRDNTLSETESYYQYRIPIRDDNGDNRLDFENNPFVTDKIDSDDGQRTWYRFKVPLDQYDTRVGSIQDFRSIRFIRMYLKEFEEQVTLRFARLELVRNQWRRYQRGLLIYQDPGQEIDTEEVDSEQETVFDVNAVNIEENSKTFPFNYILPPGIEREQSTNTTYPDILQNEQSLSMEVCGLRPQSAKAIYKNILLDMRVYKRLKMFVHAEAKDPSGDSDMVDLDAIKDGDLSVFMRIGSDFENNYYEYEIPLVMSRNNMLGYTDPDYKDEVWKALNNFDIPIEAFKEIKKLRNNSGASLTVPFEVIDIAEIDNQMREGKLRIKGNPSLGYVKGVMVGIVNRSDQSQCAEVWLNELRLSGFDERGGFAAIGKLDAQLADFGTATISGNYSTIGWGGLEEKLIQRAREEVIQFDVATNVELGKFLPEKTGIKIPFYAQFSQTISIPEYDPYDLDIPLQEKLDEVVERADRDSIREQAIDFTEIKGYNFTNVRKERTGDAASKTPMPWNIENFSLSYAYTKMTHHDPIIELDEINKYNGSVDYKFSRRATYIEPFKKLFKKDKYTKLISDFNFNLLPNSFMFNTTMNRQLQKTSYRFTEVDPKFNTFYNKQFTWDRSYNLQWDLTKALKINFNALNYAVIDELKQIDPETGLPNSQKDIDQEIWNNIKDFGRTKNYNHSVNANYTLPFKKIPMLDFINVKAQYKGDYSWSAAALNTDSLGNVIQNGQRRQINGDLNFETLYNKSTFLKKINNPRRTRGNDRGKSKTNRNTGRTGGNDTKGDTKDRNSRDDKSSGKDSRGKDSGSKDVPGKDATGKDSKTKKEKNKNGEPSALTRGLVRPLMMLRKIKVSYAENFSTIVPGYLPNTKMLGQASGFNAPGWGFVAGLQPNISTIDGNNDWLTQAGNKGWITKSVFLNQQVQQNYQETFDAKVTLEPVNDLRIEFDATKSYSENSSLYFKDTLFGDQFTVGDPNDDLRHVLPREVGSYSISYFAMNTLFNKDITGLFSTFERNRAVISRRMGGPNFAVHPTDGSEYAFGLGRYQQDVMIPAFLAAYTDKDPNTVAIAEEDSDYTKILIKELPKPNWTVSYDGLAKLPMFKDVFSKISINHGYQSTLSVNSFNTNNDLIGGQSNVQDINLNYYSRFEIPSIIINEQFAPLVGVQLDLRNGMSFDVEFSKSRNLQMSFITFRLDETKTSEYVVGFGYTMKNVELAFLTGKGKKKKSSRKPKVDPDAPGKSNENKGSDLNFQFDFSLRDDVTIIHQLDQEFSEPTRGLRQIQISPSVDYDVNKRLNVRLFFDYSKTNPKTSASFPITNTRGGIKITFSLN